MSRSVENAKEIFGTNSLYWVLWVLPRRQILEDLPICISVYELRVDWSGPVTLDQVEEMQIVGVLELGDH